MMQEEPFLLQQVHNNGEANGSRHLSIAFSYTESRLPTAEELQDSTQEAFAGGILSLEHGQGIEAAAALAAVKAAIGALGSAVGHGGGGHANPQGPSNFRFSASCTILGFKPLPFFKTMPTRAPIADCFPAR